MNELKISRYIDDMGGDKKIVLAIELVTYFSIFAAIIYNCY